MTVKNTLAYYVTELITTSKTFVIQTTDEQPTLLRGIHTFEKNNRIKTPREQIKQLDWKLG
jgi:hypothetical protein